MLNVTLVIRWKVSRKDKISISQTDEGARQSLKSKWSQLYCVSWSWVADNHIWCFLGNNKWHFSYKPYPYKKASEDFRNIRSSLAKKGCQNNFPEYLYQTLKLNFLKAEIGCYICWILTRSLTCAFFETGKKPHEPNSHEWNHKYIA